MKVPLLIIALVVVIVFSMVTCGGGDSEPDPIKTTGTNPETNPESETETNKNLSGTITISPSTGVNINTELTATYSGSEKVSYQWKNEDTNVGTNSNKYTPTEAGSYTVTVSATGYNSKTSAAVDVNDPSLYILKGTITISPVGPVLLNTELTATYTGSENVSYQWKNGTTDVGTNSNKYTPTVVGNYSVTVNAEGYNSKTSVAVEVKTILDLTGEITISPSSGTITTFTELTATYSGSENVSYQWIAGTSLEVGTNSNKYTPNFRGNFKVTVSAPGYNSKTSSIVSIVNSELSGTITISPVSPVLIRTELTATYSGSETVRYIWRNVTTNSEYANSNNSNKYTPIALGNYTVTVTSTVQGYNEKTSAAVSVVSALDLSGTITISPAGPVTAFTELTATYTGSEPVNYQWTSTYGAAVGTNSNKYTPTHSGQYRVTVSLLNYNSKDSSNYVTVNAGSPVTSTFGTSAIYAIAYGNNKYVTGGASGKMATSTDGITWTAVNDSKFGTNYIYAIAFGNNKFVAVGASGRIATSTDNGVTWTAATDSKFGTNIIYAIAYGNNKFVAVGYEGKMATSTDGITWTAVTDSKLSGGNIFAIAYGNNKFVAGGLTGRMATSTDGVTWTAVNDSKFSAYNIKAIAFGNNRFVAGGENGKMATSTDGATWTAVTDSTFGTSTINAIAYGNVFDINYSEFLAVGESGKMAFSDSRSATTWITLSDRDSPTTLEIKAIVYGDNYNRVVAGGVDGKIYPLN